MKTKMASLSSGVLVKLLEDMGMDENNDLGSRKSALLQIRSIIPMLEEGNLWPNQGYFLKVSDLSHAAYVSLPDEHNEMIMNNQLQLGQYIYVQKLEAAYPVPLLRGFKPVQGRHPCVGSPADLVGTANLVKSWGLCDSAVVSESGVEEKTWGRHRSLSPLRGHSSQLHSGRAPSSSSSGSCYSEKRSSHFSHDQNSQSDCSKSSSASILEVMRRRSNGVKSTRTKEYLDSPIVWGQRKPFGRTHSAPVSPIRAARYDCPGDNSSSLTRRKTVGNGRRLEGSDSRSKIPLSRKNLESAFNSAAMCSSVNDRKPVETKILWETLPSTIVKIGKEMLRYRDAALQAAVEALQEASAAERLIKCLSTYSHLQPTKGDNLELDKYMDLQYDLDHMSLIMQSLTNINLPRASNLDANNRCSVKEALKLAFERNKNATSWVKEAIASDLSPFPPPVSFTTASPEPSKLAVRKTSTSSRIKPSCASIVRKHKKTSDATLAVEKIDSQDWVKGIALSPAGELASSLQYECQRKVLANAEKYLDAVESKTIPMESDSQIAGTICQLKKLNDWLKAIPGKDNGCKEGLLLEESEAEACGRVKNKIYGLLLKHVERALGSTNPTAQV